MNITEIKMILNKNRSIIAGLLTIFVIAAMSLSAVSGCSLNNMVRSTYENNASLTLRDIDIDEKEVESINTLGSEMEKSYDISKEISSIADELENPFKPFYYSEETEEVKNIIILENIYLKDGSKSCEIKFNDHIYILVELDSFYDIYMVQSINETSVVLLKGDEVLTLFIGEMVQD